MTCIFCQIATHKLPAEIVFEDEDLVVFKDINPDAPIHLLIVPKRHFDTLNSLDGRTAGIVTKMVLVAKQMAEVQKTEGGYRLMINCGRAAGQVVFHLHMHLMGGWGQKPGRP